MAVPAQALDIGNLALYRLFQKPISSLTEDSKAAGVINANWDRSRRAALRNIRWNFASKRGVATLVEGSAPLFDYLYYYQLPNDWLRLLRVGTEQQQWRECVHYDTQGKLLMRYRCGGCDTSDPSFVPDASTNIYYVADITDVTQWDALFVDVMVLRLAQDACVALSGSTEVLMSIQKDLKVAVAEAQAINHQERPVRVIERDPIAAARMLLVNDGLFRVDGP